VGTVGMMLWTGYKAVGSFDIIPVFENTDVTKSLLYGSLFSLAVALILFLRQVNLKGVQGNAVGTAVVEGIKSMLPAVYILIFAWAIVTLIDELQTGTYLAGLVEKSDMPVELLPVLLFLVAAIMAFSTGTSWGSFGILLPIAGEIAAATDVSVLLPAMAAVLAGSVLGDHCSPISDTTILSSTGAGSNHIDHVLTQLPYALIGAVAAAIGYLVLGFTGSTLLGLLTVIVLVGGIGFIKGKNTESAVSQ
ncbi:Na+/H+ antiporter NhaC family protein, partial [Bacillus haikouensis]|uniref:Na+/H+ antiporter NhaC family protein n=1 Tax=Bacillus haikouensis TaxID=1510468 RepID=UPI001C131B1A